MSTFPWNLVSYNKVERVGSYPKCCTIHLFINLFISLLPVESVGVTALVAICNFSLSSSLWPMPFAFVLVYLGRYSMPASTFPWNLVSHSKCQRVGSYTKYFAINLFIFLLPVESVGVTALVAVCKKILSSCWWLMPFAFGLVYLATFCVSGDDDKTEALPE